MKYIFLVFFSTLVFGETYLTFQRNSTALVQNGFETIEAEATATNQAAYYPLYGNALDYSKNDNDGTVYGAVSTGTNYWFDGVDDYIDCGDIIIPASANFTISLWFNANDITPLAPEAIISQYLTGDDDRFVYSVYTDGRMRCFIGGISIYSNSSILDGWNHIVLIRNGNTYYFYLNGNADGSGVISSDIYQGNLEIGRYNSGGFFHGYIKDCRIYDKALTAEEINKIYNATK